GTVAVRVVAANRGARPMRVATSRDCPVRLRLYRASTTGEPAWDETRDSACSFVALVVDLAPGETREFTKVIRAGDLLRGGLHAGAYRVVAVVPIDLSVRLVDAGTLELRAAT
ncbi:MAG TPA: hypothetical protein VM890_05755, partial [Longimicrobium sp.]|nr:hypothetical protein [Longimicrobium sp.]